MLREGGPKGNYCMSMFFGRGKTGNKISGCPGLEVGIQSNGEWEQGMFLSNENALKLDFSDGCTTW